MSNNLNLVMRFLAAMTIILAIPTVISSFFGMNVALPFSDDPLGYIYILLISICLAVCGVVFLRRRNMF